MFVIFVGSFTTLLHAQGSGSTLKQENTPLNLTSRESPTAPSPLLGETFYPQLEEYLQIAVEQNPELQSLWYQYQSELEQIPQVGSLPDPEVNIGFTLNPMNSDPVLGRFTASAMQMFPWFGTLQTRRDMQRASAEAGYQKLNSRQLELFRDIQNTWFDLAELNRQIEITRENLQLIRDLESLVTVRYETARAGQADLLRIQMEEERLKTVIANLEDRINPIQSKFNAYLNRPANAEVITPEEITGREVHLDRESLREKIHELNPAFNQLDARELALNEQKNLARLNGMPSFGLGVEVMGRNSAAMAMFPDSGEMYAAMATIRIPLWRSRYSAQHRQAVQQLRSVDFSRTETENQLTAQLDSALEQYRNSVRSGTLLTEELIPRTEQALEILSEEYASGNVRFDEVLRMQEQLLDLEMEQIEVWVRQHKALINIETLVGQAPGYQRDGK
ncbi:TolC family protein [Rhodohalobacter halophilus]|uniref:TolC family protein n=1 Tax=Rhodohalobacter halophilus TaxID=1812810 RepID=UPI00159F3354|nr:TolC family protein [Rhodohalobacter halophilus]